MNCRKPACPEPEGRSVLHSTASFVTDQAGAADWQRLAEFVTEHAEDDPAALVLSRNRWPGIDVALAADSIRSRKKLAGKAPEWCAAGVLCPLPLSAEQCSGEKAARYKAELAARLYRERNAGGRASGHLAGASDKEQLSGRLADLTGGLGVDALAFSRRFSEVIYNERNPLLTAAAAGNFSRLGAPDIRIHNEEITPENIASLLKAWGRPDLVYLDPARRAADGRKVFRLADCTPDVLALRDAILSSGAILLLKLSPMADITQMVAELGPGVREVHAVEADGECKELLFVLRAATAHDGLAEASQYRVYVTDCDSGAVWSFEPPEETEAIALCMNEIPSAGSLMFAPGKALLKSGAFKLVSARLGLAQAAPSTHFYFGGDDRGPSPLAEAAGNQHQSCTEDGSPATLGAIWHIEECQPWSKQALRCFAAAFPDADVTVRGLSLRSEDLARQLQRLAHRPGRLAAQPVHIFALRCLLPSGPESLLLACRRIML